MLNLDLDCCHCHVGRGEVLWATLKLSLRYDRSSRKECVCVFPITAASSWLLCQLSMGEEEWKSFSSKEEYQRLPRKQRGFRVAAKGVRLSRQRPARRNYVRRFWRTRRQNNNEDMSCVRRIKQAPSKRPLLRNSTWQTLHDYVLYFTMP